MDLITKRFEVEKFPASRDERRTVNVDFLLLAGIVKMRLSITHTRLIANKGST